MTATTTITCAWFALCDHPAVGVVAHPALGDVPICERCAKRMDLVADVKPAVAVECPPCPVCGERETLLVAETAYDRWVEGALVQDAFPAMNIDVRELLVSGTHPACWDALFDVDNDPELDEGWDE